MTIKSIFSNVVGGAAEVLISPVTNIYNLWSMSIRHENRLATGHHVASLESPKVVTNAVINTAKAASICTGFSIPPALLAIQMVNDATRSGFITEQTAPLAFGFAVYAGLCFGSTFGNLCSNDDRKEFPPEDKALPVFPLKATIDRRLGL